MKLAGLVRQSMIRMAALTAAILIAGCSAFSPGSDISVTRMGENGPTTAVPAGTDPQDVVIGRRENPHIIAAYGGVYSYRPAEIMLAEIVGRLLTAANQADTPFTVTILDSPDVNAFALPGGFIYVTRGIMALANDKNELAAVLAHEIAHVTLKHAQARSSRAHTSEIVDQVITKVLGGNVETDQTAARSRLSLAAFSQAQELAADREGIMTAGRAGYDPHAAAQFLAAMGRFAAMVNHNAPDNGNDFLSSHPSTPDRIAKAIAIADTFGPPGAVDSGRKDYLDAIDGMQFGDNPDQGAVVGRQFIHPTLGFTFSVPAPYTLQNTPSAVVGVAGDGEAVRFDSAEVPKAMALTDYLKSGWIAGLDPASVRAESHNGVEMASGVATTDQWRFRVTAVRFNQDVYRFIFASRTGGPDFDRRAMAVISSFRQTQPADMAKIKRIVVRVIEAKAGDTTDSLAAKMAQSANAKELFLVLNNLFDGDTIVPGEDYKIISYK